MGAQNARMLVKNQWRTKTTMSVFFVSVHVCDRIAMAALKALVGVQLWFEWHSGPNTVRIASARYGRTGSTQGQRAHGAGAHGQRFNR